MLTTSKQLNSIVSEVKKNIKHINTINKNIEDYDSVNDIIKHIKKEVYNG